MNSRTNSNISRRSFLKGTALAGSLALGTPFAIWAAAFLVAYHFAGDVADLMADAVTLPSARTAMGFAGLFSSYVELFVNFNFGRFVLVSALVSVVTVLLTLAVNTWLGLREDSAKFNASRTLHSFSRKKAVTKA